MGQPETALFDLPKDILVSVVAELPDFQVKLAFASACRASRYLLADRRCWKELDVTDVMRSTGAHPRPPEGLEGQCRVCWPFRLAVNLGSCSTSSHQDTHGVQMLPVSLSK